MTSELADALTHFDGSEGPRKIGPNEGRYVDLPGVGVRFMVWTEETGGPFSLVEHPIKANHLCAPLHRHTREDEYSYVLEGRLGALLGDDVVHAGAGELVFKPRGQWHTFWNAGDEPCRILEIIAPGGFERFFEELGSVEEPPTPAFVDELGARYGLEFDMDATARIAAEHALTFPPLEPSA